MLRDQASDLDAVPEAAREMLGGLRAVVAQSDHLAVDDVREHGPEALPLSAFDAGAQSLW